VVNGPLPILTEYKLLERRRDDDMTDGKNIYVISNY